MVCCYQVTEIYSSRYGFAIASSAWGPCNLGPFTDLAISVFGKMSIHIVLTQILTSLCQSALMRLHKKNWRESLPVMEFRHPPKFSLNSCSHSGISGSSHRFPRSIVVSFFTFVFGIMVGLGFHRFPRSIINQLRQWHWRDVTIRCIFPFSNRHFAYCR